MPDEVPRSRVAREAAERALVAVVRNYGSEPEFVVLGGLVPDWLCASSPFTHAGTSDVDVQVDLEIGSGAVNGAKLEEALRAAGFEPEQERIWRWLANADNPRIVIKFELLADRDDAPTGADVIFDKCEALGAANLPGTRFAAMDFQVQQLSSSYGEAKVKVTGLAGFLLAKCAAARARGKEKDWYDIAFVLLHNDSGGPEEAADAVVKKFGEQLEPVRTALIELSANFANQHAQGPRAYAEQMLVNHPNEDRQTLLADAVAGVDAFVARLQKSAGFENNPKLP